MNDPEKIQLVAETADKLGVDPITKSVASMAAVFSADSAVNILGMGVNAKLTKEAEESNPLKSPRGKYNRVERQLISMLTENTSAHFLDSGGAYGRAWQRNRGIMDWHDISETEVDTDVWTHEDTPTWGVSITRNIFPYLANRLALDKDTTRLNSQFTRFANRKENEDMGWPQLMEAFVDFLHESNEDIRKQGGGNTYNGESTLSQVLQYEIFTEDKSGECYAILQIHGGADVRGGYTRPHIFKALDDYSEGCPSFIFDEHDIYASCKCVNASSDDCGYHWYVDGSSATNEYQDEKYTLPKIWAPKEMVDHSPLVCSKCNQKVNFT